MNNKTINGSRRAYYFIAPALILITIFTIYPIFNAFYLSFQDPRGNLSLSSYEYVLTSSVFWKAVKNTLIYAVVVTPISLSLSLVISYMLSLKIKFQNTFQTMYFLPYVTSTIAIGSVFAMMYHTNYGVLNGILTSFGLSPIGWLTDPKYSMLAVIIFGIWKSLAFNILIMFTALQGIDENLEKAALVDHASSLTIFLKVKVPQIYPVVAYLLVIDLIYNFKVYEEVVSLFKGNAGIDNSAMTMVYYIYQQFYTIHDFSLAAVGAVMLLIIVGLLTILNKFVSKRLGGN
ncbi:sugar ABC transporter permease [Mollicutes bacterium LVI A0039]|nr:sugar ABC transporter permease [Mollicutes bacterium LVI A0039]